MNLEILNKHRVTSGDWATKNTDNFGAFEIYFKTDLMKILCAPMDSEWQHVSCSFKNRTPTWDEMCTIKKLFFGEDVTVVQFHPKKSNYKNVHKYCLHLWRHKNGHELPPDILV